MRLSPDILVQQIIDHGDVVIMDESTDQEIVVNEEIAAKLIPALHYFFPAIFAPHAAEMETLKAQLREATRE